MKLYKPILIMFLAIASQTALPQQATAPLTKNQVMDLVKFGMDGAELAKKIEDFGLDFDPSDDYLESLRKAGAQEVVIQAIREVKPMPLTREQVGKLVAGGVPNERAAILVKQHGIDFFADGQYLQTLRVAGADDALIDSLSEASVAAMGLLLISTSRNAEVYLDGELRGRANDHGFLSVKAEPGDHSLRVALSGKDDFHLSVSLAPRQTTRIEATLVDTLPAEVDKPTLTTEIWHSETTGHDFRVELTDDLFRAEWVNIPDVAAKRGAYIRTECHRTGSKWVGSSNVTVPIRVVGARLGKDTKLCSFTVRFEVDSISAGKITGHSESLHSFDANACRVQQTTWAEFTWVPKK